MISYSELLHGHVVNDLTMLEQQNLQDLQKKINMIRTAWGKPMIVTSGFRTEQDQLRINPKAKNSAHRYGMAVDIQDKDGSLMKWLKENEPLLEKAGLWIEADTKGWVHFQTRRASKRFFQP